MHRRHLLLILGLPIARVAAAQDSTLVPRLEPRATLTLSDALSQAQAHSPAYRQTLNNAGPARWAVRNAYGQFLPSLQVSGGVNYTGSGVSQFGAFFQQTLPFVGSNYQIGLQMQLDGRTLVGPSQQKALERATSQEIQDAGVGLRADITIQYLTAVAAAAATDVARHQVDRNGEFLKLARARYQVGQATLLDVKQAEATRGTSEVALLRAYQAENESKLELFRRMGVVAPVSVGEVSLTDSFPVTEPTLKLPELLQLAEKENPSLRALEERRTAAHVGVRAARSEFFHQLRAQAGWSGFTQQYTNEAGLIGQQLPTAQAQASQCQFENQVRTGLNLGGQVSDCFGVAGLDPTGTAFSNAARQAIVSRNNNFPVDFTAQPFQASLSISLPIFTGFGRSLRLAQARAAREDADESVRAQGLQVRANVEARFLALEIGYKAIGVQELSRAAAREQLRLAQNRYRVGLGTALDVTDGQNAVLRAENDYISAVYDYHRAFAALEAAVGRPLR